MKIAALLAANVLIVGAGILTYDVMRSDTAAPVETAEAEAVDLSRIEERLLDVERRLDGINVDSSDRRVSGRLRDFESRLASVETSVPTPAIAGTPADEGAASLAADDGSIADADVEKIKRVMEKIDNERENARATQGVERLLGRLDLQLTDDQKKRLGDEFTTFRGEMRDLFRNGRTEGVTREDMMAKMETLRDSFADSLETFLPATDVETIVSEMGNGPGGGRRGPGGGGFGGGGGIR